MDWIIFVEPVEFPKNLKRFIFADGKYEYQTCFGRKIFNNTVTTYIPKLVIKVAKFDLESTAIKIAIRVKNIIFTKVNASSISNNINGFIIVTCFASIITKISFIESEGNTADPTQVETMVESINKNAENITIVKNFDLNNLRLL